MGINLIRRLEKRKGLGILEFCKLSCQKVYILEKELK